MHSAEILAVGSELLVGETRDTNSGDLAGALTALGVEVLRMSQLPDELDVVREAIRSALARADLVVTSGGLGPTPDDLTREAVCSATGRELDDCFGKKAADEIEAAFAAGTARHLIVMDKDVEDLPRRVRDRLELVEDVRMSATRVTHVYALKP